MNPIYKFDLTVNGVTKQVYPVYKDDLAIDFAKETNQEFFRAKLSGKLTFQRGDYDLIVSQAFDTQFNIVISISYDRGQTWAQYWNGTFWKTDCEFDDDDKTVVVELTVKDRYNEVLAGLEKEYDLIELAPEIVPVKADKRPMIQVYVPGQSVIGCFLSGMWWEQECEPVNESDTVTISGQTYPALTHKYHFSLAKTQRIVDVTAMGSPEIPDVFMGAKPNTDSNYEFVNGAYKARMQQTRTDYSKWQIIRVSDSVVMWESYEFQSPVHLPVSFPLSPVAGTGATGTVEIYVHDMPVYSRYILDVAEISGLSTYEIPDDDLVENNRNYRRVIGYYFPETIFYSTLLTETPTEWGIYQPGQYYQKPESIFLPEFFPVARNAWGRVSLWFTFSSVDWLVEQSGRQPFTIRHAYPLSSAISVLLGKIAPGVTHEATTDYSQFLYGQNLVGVNQTLLIVPKSNIVTAGYDQPAQKAPVTLQQITTMLRDCFRCYWFIDEQNRFRVEHIQYFRNGGSYSGGAQVGIDLTQQIVTRNGKPWAFASDKYKFDKPEMAARYQFGWMDDVTTLFNGYPIDIVSRYVNPDNIENVSIQRFTSDIDYILLNPSEISKDGFVLLAAVMSDGQLVLPYTNYNFDATDHYLQNGYVAFVFLQQYYAYDMPAWDYSINGRSMRANGIKKLKNQTVKFPALIDPDLQNLIKTNLGNGMIEKLSLNLSSRAANATLKYDTE